jgi:preprotein translocase subunit SecG
MAILQSIEPHGLGQSGESFLSGRRSHEGNINHLTANVAIYLIVPAIVICLCLLLSRRARSRD